MAKQKSKVDLLKDIQTERRQLEKMLSTLAEEDMLQPGVVGEWSVKDILAHLVAWEQLFLGWYAAGVQGKIPETQPVEMSKSKIDALNQTIYAQYCRHSLADVLVIFHSSYQGIQTALQAITEEEMLTPGRYAWTGKWLLVDFIAGNTCNHYYWAKTKIHAWRKAHRQ
jgi:hypothetical protein